VNAVIDGEIVAFGAGQVVRGLQQRMNLQGQRRSPGPRNRSRWPWSCLMLWLDGRDTTGLGLSNGDSG
jgi:hypothetical protein